MSTAHRHSFCNLPAATMISAIVLFGNTAAMSHDSLQYTEESYNESYVDSIPTVDLNEFVVKGDTYSMNANKITISPPDGTVEVSQFATDLLGRLGIPGLTYNQMSRDISINGATPVILVNGTLADMNRLRAIKASDVVSVQFSRTVPLAYQKYGDTLIDIRTRNIPRGGDVMVYAISNVQCTAPDASASVNFNQGPSKFNLYYYYTHRSNRDVTDDNNQSFLSPEMQVDVLTAAQAPFNYNIHEASLDYIYNPSDNLVFQSTLKLGSTHRHTYSHATGHDSMTGEIATAYNRKESNLLPTLDLYLQKRFGRSDMIQIQLNGTLNNTDYDSNDSYTEADHVYDYINWTESKRRALISTLVYTHTFNNSTILEADYENTVSHTSNTYISDNPCSVNELNNYIYLQFQKGFGDFWLTANSGIRFDRTTYAGIHYSHTHNTSSLDLAWNPNRKFSVNLKGIYTPLAIPINMLIDRPQQTLPYLITTGNPELRKSTQWNLQLNAPMHFGIFTAIPSVSYKRTLNPIARGYEFHKGAGAFYATPENLRYSDALNLKAEGWVNGIAGMFNINGYIAWSRMRTTDRNDFHIGRNAIGGAFSVEWYMRNWAIAYSRNFPLWTLNGYTLRKDSPSDMLGVMWRPNSHWTICAKWSYMFAPRGYTYDYQVISPGYRETFNRSVRNNANNVTITVAYYIQFGSPFTDRGAQRTLHKKDSQTTVTTFDK